MTTLDSLLASKGEHVFTCRIVSIDYYLSKPIECIDNHLCPFSGNQLSRIPIIRIFGITPIGQKTCFSGLCI